MKNLAWLLVLAACGGSDDSRECALSSECEQGNIPGECLVSSESDKKFCAYPDGSCPSGSRWGVAAGDGLAGQCAAAAELDAGVDASQTDDAGAVDGGDRLGSWSEPQLLLNVNSEHDELSPSISSTGLELYFVSDRPGGTTTRSVYVARRASTAEPFGTPVEVPEIGRAWNVELAESGLELYVQNFQTSDSNVFVSSRATPAAVWSTPSYLPFTGEFAFISSISLSGDALAMYLGIDTCANRPCLRRIGRSAPGGSWSDVGDRVEPGFVGLDYLDIDISPDELGVVLCEPRSGSLAAAVESRRPTKAVPFADFESISTIDRETRDCAFNSDRSELYMAVMEDGGFDLAVAVRQPR
jgi:hypothetical protein